MKGFVARLRELVAAPAGSGRQAQARALQTEMREAQQSLREGFASKDQRLTEINEVLLAAFEEAHGFFERALGALERPEEAREYLRIGEDALHRADALVEQVRQAMLKPSDFGRA